MEKKMKIVYQAYDRSEFDTERACRDYEANSLEYACEALGAAFLI